MNRFTLVNKYFSVRRRDIAYLHFIIESYEGLATLSTIDARKGIVRLSIPECLVEDVEKLLLALREEIPMVEPPFQEACSEPAVPPESGRSCHHA